MKYFCSLFCCALILFSCSDTKKENKDGHHDSAGMTRQEISDSAHVFILPGPLQIPTTLKQYCGKAETNLLSASTGPVSETEYNLAMNLGVCLADAGYAGLYSQRQATLHQLERAEILIRKLHLDNIAIPYFTRVRSNLENADSLSTILLSLYEKTQAELNSSGKERIAFFVTSGCYIENLHLSLSSRQLINTPAFAGILGQQHVWLNSLTESLTYLPQDNDTQDLYNTLYTLQHYFEPIQLSKSGNIYSGSMMPEDLDLLHKKTDQLRESILKS